MKLLTLALVIGVVVSVFLFQSTPVPSQSSHFQEAKRLALTAQPDQNGNYFKSIMGLNHMKYTVGYCPKERTIGVIIVDTDNKNLMMLVVYDEEKDNYQAGVYQGETALSKGMATKEQADRFCEKVLSKFRKVV